MYDRITKSCVKQSAERCVSREGRGDGNYCKGGTARVVKGTQCDCVCPPRTKFDNGRTFLCERQVLPWCRYKNGANHCLNGDITLVGNECKCKCGADQDWLGKGQPCRNQACKDKTMKNFCSNYGYVDYELCVLTARYPCL